MQIKAVGEKDFCQVFSFMGAQTFVVKDPQEALSLVESHKHEESLVLISLLFYYPLRERFEELKTKSRAVILEIPSPSQPSKEEFDPRRLLQTIIGMRI